MHKMTQVGVLALAVSLASCTSLMQPQPTASADLLDASGKVTGKATFAPTSGGTNIKVNVSGLAPGQHALHIHLNPSCANSTNDAGQSVQFGGAGGHFDPGGSNAHGSPTTDNAKGHGGDMPMIVVGADGTGSANFTTSKVSLSGADSAVNRSIVIHAGADDFTTNPAGNSGARERCGIIKSI